MTKQTILLCAGLLAGMTCLGGCLSKKIGVTFTNLTEEKLDVYLSGPGKGAGVIGTLNGRNDRVHTQLTLAFDELPAQYNWTAGSNYSGRFTIANARKPKPVYVDVGQAARSETKPTKPDSADRE
jgi:hypothetical protein